MEKLKQLQDLLEKVFELSRQAVESGEHHLMPIFHNTRDSLSTLQQRIQFVESWLAEQKAAADAAKKEAAQAKVSAPKSGKTAAQSLGTLA